MQLHDESRDPTMAPIYSYSAIPNDVTDTGCHDSSQSTLPRADDLICLEEIMYMGGSANNEVANDNVVVKSVSSRILRLPRAHSSY